MFSVAELLDRAKNRAAIDTDYRLAKVLQINQSAIWNYRHGKNLPNEKVIDSLCALSGDDPDVIAAQIQSERSQDAAAKGLWLRIAHRLQAGALGALIFGAGFGLFPSESHAMATSPVLSGEGVYIMLNKIFKEPTMESSFHHFAELFAQLGLPTDVAHIRGFIAQHGGLSPSVRLDEAPFWTPAQAGMLREELLNDADWAAAIDQLNNALRSK